MGECLSPAAESERLLELLEREEIVLDAQQRLDRLSEHTPANLKPQPEGEPVYRQGDVLIKPVTKIPKGLKKVPRDRGRVILAYGEVTGHAHAILERDVQLLAADVEEMEQRFLRVEQEAQVVHDEHDTITLPPGDYEITRQREYSPEAIRTVAD